jgi:DNA-binding NarL/FixJ family response regulator
MIRVLLIDNQAAVRRGLRLRLALEPDLAVVGEVDNAEQALVLAQTLLPDVVVMDIAMSDVEGIEAIRRFRDMTPSCAVVILTLRGDAETRTLAQEAGAQALIEKQGGAEVLLEVIREVVQDSLQLTQSASGGSEERHRLQKQVASLQSLGPEGAPQDQGLGQLSLGLMARGGDLRGVPLPMQQEPSGWRPTHRLSTG